MKKLHSYYYILFVLVLVISFASSSWAQDMGALKAQMLKRKPTIDAMKNQGVIGEGNDGYLHVRKAADNAQQVVQAENADRRAVNQVIAKKEGTTVDVVSRKLAAKLQALAVPGHWLQKKDGTWHQKK